MNPSPRLDNDIPKGYTYIKVSRRNDLDAKILELKGKRDKESKEILNRLQDELKKVNNLIFLLNTRKDINLYFNTEIIQDISLYESSFSFDDHIIYKIEPIAMKKTWASNGKYPTYDLNSFRTVERFDSMANLIGSLNEDGILKEFTLTHFLAYFYLNKGYSDIRLKFLRMVKAHYGQEYLPSLYDFFDRYSDYNGENYKKDTYRMEYIREAYKEGLVNLHHPWKYTEVTIKFLLIEKAYDILDDFIASFDDRTKELMQTLNETNSSPRTMASIIRLCNEQSDNPSVVSLMEFMKIKKSGIILNIWKCREYDVDYIEHAEKFDDIEKVKRYLLKNYDNIPMDKVMSGNINGLEFHEDEEWHKIELIVE